MFNDCTKIESIVIPHNVTIINHDAFKGWTSDQTIYIEGYSSAPEGWSTDWNKNKL